MTCGSKNTLVNITWDLTNNKNMYYLNPLMLLTASGINYAKSICSTDCPGIAQQCGQSQMPCWNDNQFMCPYYRFAEDNIYGRIPASAGVAPWDYQYFSDLALIPNITDPGVAPYIAKLKGLGGVFASEAAKLEANMSGVYYQLKSQFPGNGPCYPILFETVEFFYRCFPKYPSDLTDKIAEVASSTAEKYKNNTLVQKFSDTWNSQSQKWARYVGDISRGVLVIVIGGLCTGLVVSMLWLVVLRFMGGVMVWFAIVFINLAMIAACLFTWVKAGYIGDGAVEAAALDALPFDISPAKEEEKTWFWIAIVASIGAGIVLLITLLCITRIKIAVACIKVASQAVGAMPTIIFFPILPFIFEVGLIIYWVAVTALLYSAGDLTAHCAKTSPPAFSFSNLTSVSNLYNSARNFDAESYAMQYLNSTLNNTLNAATLNGTRDVCYANVSDDARAYLCGNDPNCYLSYDWNNNMKYAFIYHFFGLLWTNQVIIGFSCVTIAGAIAHFYWSRGDSANMPTFPVLTALKNTVFYHMGSICFGAFIIALIQLIRFLLEYLDRKTKELQAQNKFAEWMMCCVKCCMWCLEKIVQFINRNAYIMIAVKGKGYCCSAIKAVRLIINNCLRVAVVNLVADVLIFLGKVSVAAVGGVVAYAMTEADYYTNPTKYPETFLYSPVLPIALSCITAFAVAEIFFAVYEMAIDTIILAFCEDCDKNGGTPKYAPPLLMEVMGGDKEEKGSKA
ncbi:hypothetical protein HYH03_008120 [Edaphochlamys debaryana]|uniref:Choline transporter-like protein n=1 Tax=Edaphochlamys debaryana TaxID=47281 RepID=A0A836BZN8_9CHLO|nr:hypothetical protein HYH03_008120 [Edaphochlamys debaryana]|eukprot:KAG2493603.1 hypothetical protein HYH03_008120 [Edaphochlamys debaryana]